ncbi:DegV family protein [Mollicutes bacterium LVI A0078]|nr:DegV family protein [Mollicutes bacterium LVI A0075]WOO90443.1 DegV family protein [Mollicutes bacterium LVI A0078]
MNKTAILLDSTFYMKAEELEKYNFYVVPLTVNFEHISFSEDATDPSQIVEVFYKIDESKKLPQTSQPSTSEALKIFDKIKSDGYNRVISLHISGALSGTAQGMKIAAEQYMEENEGLAIEVYDSSAAAQVSAVIAKTIAKVIEKHGDISSEQVAEIISFVSENTEAYVFVDKLDYLAYGGRIPAAIASVGNLFGISPIITLTKEGGLDRYKAERSQKKAILSIIKLLQERDFSDQDNLILNGFYTTESKMAKKMLKECAKVTNAHVIESESSPMGIVISNHLGPNAFGVYWSKEYKI